MTREEVLQWLRTELPPMLREDPMFRAQVIGLLSEALVTKAEFTQMLDELRAMRLESERQFAQGHARHDAHDQRFDQVDQRFDQVDQRFDQVEQHLAAHDQRFDQVDQRFDQVEQHLAAHDQRFDQVDQRFDQVEQHLAAHDQRFDQVDQRFDQVEQHLTAHDQRFDQVDQRLSTHDQLLEDLRAEVAKVAVSVGALGGRMGWKMEDVIRRVIEHFSGLRKLKAEPFTIIDDTGECFQSGATIEFDALVTNGRKFLVEVKSYAKPGDVWAFHRKARFAEKKLNETFDKVLIAPAASQAALDLAKELGITCYTFSVEG